jgi:hypothetical protein
MLPPKIPKIKRMELALENGLKVSVIRLCHGKLEHLRRAYREYLKKHQAEWAIGPNSYAEFYAVTFHFKRPLRALVHEWFIETALKTLVSTTPEDALDNCMCIFISNRLAYATIPEHDDKGRAMLFLSDPDTALKPAVRALKKSIENNVDPSAAALVYLETPK